MTATAAAPVTCPAGRAGPKRTAPWDAILDRWATGERSGPIAAALGIKANAVTRVVHHARKLGDTRAKRRKAPTGKPGSGHVKAGEWVPYYADPRQLPLPFPQESAAP